MNFVGLIAAAAAGAAQVCIHRVRLIDDYIDRLFVSL